MTLAAHCLREGEPSLDQLPVRLALHYLLSGEEKQVTVPDDLRAFCADAVSTGVKEMRSFLLDVESNAPLGEGEFPRKECGLCQSCNFTRLCKGRRLLADGGRP